MSSEVVIVGSGIVGLAHACAAHEKGYKVTVLERSGRPLGASVRNFGTIWPIGQPRGPLRALADRSRDHWGRLSEEAGFWFDPSGSLHLSYMDEGWAVLQEYVACADPEEGLELLDPDAVRDHLPYVNPNGLRGALYSPHEAAVLPSQAMDRLIAWLGRQGVSFQFHTTAVAVDDHAVVSADGTRRRFDRLVVCGGDEMRLLYGTELQQAGVRRCKLQMMRTVPQPPPWRALPIAVADLTLRHYASFAECASLEALRVRVAETMSEYDTWGIHTIAAQKPDGSFIVGDSHEYGCDFDPGSSTEVDGAVLRYLRSFLRLPNLSIAHRWTGTYLQTTNGSAFTILEPQPDVQVVTGLGGAGMTLSLALAEDVVAAW